MKGIFFHKFALFVVSLLADSDFRQKKKSLGDSNTFTQFQLLQLLYPFVKMFLLVFMPCVKGTAFKVCFSSKCKHQSEADGLVNAMMLLCKPCYLCPHVSVYTAVQREAEKGVCESVNVSV